MDENEARKRREITDIIEVIISKKGPHSVKDIVGEVYAKTGRKRGVQSLLETDKRFVLVKTDKVSSLNNLYGLAKSGQNGRKPPVHPAKTPRQATAPRVGFHGGPVRRDYVEQWVSDPFGLLGRGEALVVDVSNLLGRQCGGMLHENGACPKPVSLWPLLKLLGQAKLAKAKWAFFVDASTRHHVQGREGLENLVDSGIMREVPASYTADSKLLAWANENHGIVLTNDYKMRASYANLYAWVDDSTRFIGHMVDDEPGHKMSYVRKFEPRPDHSR